jgi:hypothetical protein
MNCMSDIPSPNGANGRQANGRFAPGNAGGPGNPHGRRVAQLRAVLLETVTDDDLRAVVQRLVGLAKSGHVPAIRELLDRLLGKGVATVAVEQSNERDFLTREQMRDEIMERINALPSQEEEEGSATTGDG